MLIDFIKQNPWLLLILISWLVSAFGGVMQKAAKKAQEQQQKAQQRASGDGEADAKPSEIDPTVAARRIEEFEERQRERRRGREAARAARESNEAATIRAASKRRATTAPPPVPVEIVEERRLSLSEEIARKEAAWRERDRRRYGRPTTALGSDIASRHLEIHSTEDAIKATEVAQSAGRRAHIGVPAVGLGGGAGVVRSLIDLDRPARAFVSMEVLGTPVGMRDRPIGRPYH